jgi:polyprenyl-phospho-N-acetylgalactosaminyl synthase
LVSALATASPSPAPRTDSVLPWIVIPAYNEATRLGAVLQDLRLAGDYPIIVVDDGSRDGTSQVAKKHSVYVLRHIINRGQGAALQTGIDFAFEQGALWIVTFDADGQHLASDLPTVLEPLRNDSADLVLGSRFLGNAINMPWSRGLLLRAAVLFTRLTTGLKLTDTHNGLRGIHRRVVQQLRISEDGMAHASEMLRAAANHHLRVTEVPVTIRYSTESVAKGQSNSAAFRILGRLLLRKILS